MTSRSFKWVTSQTNCTVYCRDRC